MILESITTRGFRNLRGGYENEDFSVHLCSGINIFEGGNAQGKTNIIEALYFCATAHSHRTNIYKDLINFERDCAFLRAVVTSGDPAYHDRIDVVLKSNKKGISINGVPVNKLGDLFGMLYCVIFSPEDLNLIKSGPGERRKFMDMELCQISKVYYHELKQYYKVLKQRNSLLKTLSRNKEKSDTLFVWDEQLVNSGSKIYRFRKDFVERLSSVSSSIHAKLACDEKFCAVYKPSVTPGDFMGKLLKSREKDIVYGTTSYGIHKDDIIFYVDNLESRSFSSQGQQRTAALSLKLAEIKIIEEEKKESPILLLDDVMSELDKKRQESLMNTISGIQTIITCTGVEGILYGKIKERHDILIFGVEGGKITK